MPRLLILEDDAQLQARYRRLLSGRYDVWVWSSREAARLWQQLAQGYQVLGLDAFAVIISSPWLELGPDEPCAERLIRTLRRQFAKIPVILAGRSRTTPVWVRLLKAADPGVESLFPVEEEALTELVERLLKAKILAEGGVR